MRYIRAFFVALWLTLAGKQPEKKPYAPLLDWIDRTQALVSEVFRTAEQQQMSKAEREALKLVIEGRQRSMQNILATVAYHAAQEYPHMLQHEGSQHSLTAIYATNMNDQHSVMRLSEAESLTNENIKAALTALREHLSAIPPSKDLVL